VQFVVSNLGLLAGKRSEGEGLDRHPDRD